MIPPGPQPARFAELPRQSDAETARWDEYFTLHERIEDLELQLERLETYYPKLTMPDIVAEACDALNKAGDLLRKRAGQLEDGPDA